eukprot:g3678.t1
MKTKKSTHRSLNDDDDDDDEGTFVDAFKLLVLDDIENDRLERFGKTRSRRRIITTDPQCQRVEVILAALKESDSGAASRRKLSDMAGTGVASCMDQEWGGAGAAGGAAGAAGGLTGAENDEFNLGLYGTPFLNIVALTNQQLLETD